MMSNPLTIIITHERMALCLRRATEKILGKQKNFFPYSTLKDSLPILAQKINQKIKKINPDHIVCFVDLMGGSCWNLANLFKQEHKNVTIISGVNLPMLISYFTHVNEMSFQDFITKVIDDGSRGIKYVKESF